MYLKANCGGHWMGGFEVRMAFKAWDQNVLNKKE